MKRLLVVAVLVAAVSAEARISHGGVYNTSGIGHGGVFNPVLGPGGQQRLLGPGGQRHLIGPGGQQHLLGPGGEQRLLGPGGTRRTFRSNPVLGPGGTQRLLGPGGTQKCASGNLLLDAKCRSCAKRGMNYYYNGQGRGVCIRKGSMGSSRRG